MEKTQKQRLLDAQEKRELSKIVPNAVALAMGVASIVLSVLDESQTTIGILLGFGIVVLAIAGMNSIETEVS